MRRQRLNYIALSYDYTAVLKELISEGILSLIPEHTNVIYMRVHYVVRSRKKREFISKNSIDALEESTDQYRAARLRQEIDKPSVPETRTELEKYGLAGYELIHIPINLDMDGRNFFLSEKTKAKNCFLSVNIIAKSEERNQFRILKHYMESELRSEYASHLIKSAVKASNIVDKTTEYADPSDQYILYIEQLCEDVPDIDIVYWRVPEQEEFLQCDACSDVDFDCDILEPQHEISDCVRLQQRLNVTSISSAKRKEGAVPGVYFACFDHGWRSAVFSSVTAARQAAGVIGVFVGYPGGVPEIYEELIDLIRQQTARFIAEKMRLGELIELKGELKKLVPLLAAGNEVLQRNHDIRDQMTIVRSGLISIRDAGEDASTGQLGRTASKALAAMDKMTEVLSKQLQGFKAAKESRKTVVLGEMMARVQESMKILAEMDKVNIEYEMGDQIKVRVQRFYMERVIENIIGNAIYFSRQSMGENRINISIAKSGSYAEIKVKDSGPGIIQKPIEKIFEWGETTKPDGYGIGLAVAAEIVASHGGALEAQNDAEGGATLVMMLPLASA